MLEKLRESAPLGWFRKVKVAERQLVEAEDGVEKIYLPNHTTPGVLVVSLCLIVFVPVAGSLLVSPQTSSDMSSVLAVVFGMIAFLNLMLIVVVRLFPFVFPHPLDEVRIRGRVITLRRGWQNRSLWLGDLNRLVWDCKNVPRVHLVSHEADFVIPLATLHRADSVELFEWLRWGSPVGDEQWPEFCHKIALPRRGPIDRALRECERRRTRRGWDRSLAYLAVALAVAGAIGLTWTGQNRWFAPLWMIPALWMWRFTIPKEGKIVIRYSLSPTANRLGFVLMAMLVGLAVSLALAVNNDQGFMKIWSVVLTGVLTMMAIAVAVGMVAEQSEFSKEQTSLWLERAARDWDAGARSRAWALGRDHHEQARTAGSHDS